MDFSYPNFVNNKENDNENLTIFSGFNNILIYIVIFISKIVSSLKIKIFMKVKNFCYFSITDENQSEFLSSKNILFEGKYESIENLKIKEMKDDNNDIKESQIKKRKYNINKNNIIIKHYIIIIKLIIINILCQITNTRYSVFYFHNSKITLKTKGIGEYSILENDTHYTFYGINFLNEVKINGEVKNSIACK